MPRLQSQSYALLSSKKLLKTKGGREGRRLTFPTTTIHPATQTPMMATNVQPDQPHLALADVAVSVLAELVAPVNQHSLAVPATTTMTKMTSTVCTMLARALIEPSPPARVFQTQHKPS